MTRYDEPYFSYNLYPIRRTRGEFVVGAGSYITGERIYDKYYGLIHDHSYRTDILYAGILLPESAPSRFYDLENLLNGMESVEGRDDSQTARAVRMSLVNNKGIPKEKEFTVSEYIELVQNYVNDVFVSQGMCAIVAIHEGINEDEPEKDNPHVHCLLSTRTVTKDGFGLKNRKWNNLGNATKWRDAWAKAQNREFERKKLKIRVSAKSHVMLGIDREPIPHRSKAILEMEKRGIETDRSIKYQDVIKKNQELVQERQREHERGRERSR